MNFKVLKTVLERDEPIFYDGVSFVKVRFILTEISGSIHGRFLPKYPFLMGENEAGVADKISYVSYVLTSRRSKELT